MARVKIDLNEKFEAMSVYEKEAFAEGFHLIAGIDEVGRGPLAGPVVTAAVILDPKVPILGLDDSKKLSPKKRAALKLEIEEKAIAIGIGILDEKTIDRINILEATKEAMRMAVSKLDPKPQSVSIAAASIVAKETRDAMMVVYDELYPGYGFAKHKGYGTKEHIEAIKSLGPCPIHRRTFITHFVS